MAPLPLALDATLARHYSTTRKYYDPAAHHTGQPLRKNKLLIIVC